MLDLFHCLGFVAFVFIIANSSLLVDSVTVNYTLILFIVLFIYLSLHLFLYSQDMWEICEKKIKTLVVGKGDPCHVYSLKLI